MSRDVSAEIQEIVDRETRAWDTQDVALLLSIFHRDFVWPWPTDPDGHDPFGWVMPMGRFDDARWARIYTNLFEQCRLEHNRRVTQKITVSTEGDGALAVVDVDTLWIDRETREAMHWLGRAGKVYALTADGWKLTMHTGLLAYPTIEGRARATSPLPVT